MENFGWIGGAVSGCTAVGIIISMLVRMRRDIDQTGAKTDQMAVSVGELKSDMRDTRKELTDLRVAFADLASTIRNNHSNNVNYQQQPPH